MKVISQGCLYSPGYNPGRICNAPLFEQFEPSARNNAFSVITDYMDMPGYCMIEGVVVFTEFREKRRGRGAAGQTEKMIPGNELL